MMTRREYGALLRQDFNSFITRTFQTVVPGAEFLPNWHIESIAHHLAAIKTGDIRRLIITIPPRHLKSISASVAFPAWLLGHDPSRRIICVSYSQELANKHALDTRAVMQSDWYRGAFPRTRFNPQKSPLHDLITTQSGYRYSTSVGGTLTGRGGNLIILDDPNKADEVESRTGLQKTIDWYGNTLYTRLDNKRTDPIILIQQRLHENDLVGYLLDMGGWFHLNLPAIAEEEEYIQTGDESWQFREEGDLLHPERESQETLDELKEQMGSYRFAAQYQQRPVPAEGGGVKLPWFKWYDRPPKQLTGDLIVQSWDTAICTGEDNDWSVCTTWLVRENYNFLLDVLRMKLEVPQLLKKIRQHGRAWKAHPILIEAVGAGKALYQQLRETEGLSFIAIQPDGDKESRMLTESPVIEAGQVILPREAPWLADFLHEILNFPKGTHDDQVDSLSQFLFWLRMRRPYRPKLECRVTVVPAATHYSTDDIMNCPLP